MTMGYCSLLPILVIAADAFILDECQTTHRFITETVKPIEKILKHNN